MINDGFLFIGVLLALSGVIIWVDQRTHHGFFRYVPGFVLMYFAAALLNTVGVFGDGTEIETVGGGVQDALLPAMILLLLFTCDIRRVLRLGPKLLLTLVVTSASIIVGFVVAYLLLQSALDDEAWKALGALNASWTGGSANMVAVQGILEAPESVFGYVLIVDTVLYSFWLLLMFSSVGVSEKFNRWTKADTTYLDAHTGSADEQERARIDLTSLAITLCGGIAASAAATWVGGLLPEIGVVVTAQTWTILIVSVLGLVIASTPLGRTAGSSEVAMVMLYLIIGIIASGSDFTSLTEAPLYLLAGIIVLAVHVAIMVVYAKATRTELFSLAVASTANIGGVASAPVVASAFNRQLVPVGVLFALVGAFAGTFLGLMSAQIMAVL